MHENELNVRLAELEAALIAYGERFGLTDQARRILSEPKLRAIPSSQNKLTQRNGGVIGSRVEVVTTPDAPEDTAAPTSAQEISIVHRIDRMQK